ncbi:MAG: hypothetical protein ACXWAX_11560, partial [Chthoniobacterales bacterium]
PVPKPRRPKANALKHGVFSATHFLPGEDPDDFDKLRLAVFEEWLPDGATEEDAALDIARAIWLRRRYENYKIKKFAGAFISRRRRPYIHRLLTDDLFPFAEKTAEWMKRNGVEFFPAQELESGVEEEDAVLALMSFSASLFGDSDEQQIHAGLDSLPDRYATYLRDNFPASEYETTRDWAFTLKEFIDTLVIPSARKALARIAAYAAQEKFGESMLQDLTINERINTMLEKSIKRLVQVKALKEMRVSIPRTSEARQIEG